MTRNGWPFAEAVTQQQPRRSSPDDISTAAALAWFRDELASAGFDEDTVRALVLTAAGAEIRRSGLSVSQPGHVAAPAAQ